MSKSTSIKKYPSRYTNIDAWTAPGNVLAVEDGLCTSKNSVSLATKRLGLYQAGFLSYDFGLPASAILDNIYLDHIGCSDQATAPGLSMEWISTNPTDIIFQDNPSVGLLGGNCATTAYAGERDILPLLISNGRKPTISEINTETNWYTQITAYPDKASAERFFVDAAYIRIVYHLPSVSGHLGDGLSCISINNNNNKPPRGRPLSRTTKGPLGALLLLLSRTT